MFQSSHTLARAQFSETYLKRRRPRLNGIKIVSHDSVLMLSPQVRIGGQGLLRNKGKDTPAHEWIVIGNTSELFCAFYQMILFPQRFIKCEYKNKDCIFFSEQPLDCQFPSVCFLLIPVKEGGVTLKLEWFIKAQCLSSQASQGLYNGVSL